MTEELEQLLKNLKLRRILEIYEEQLRAADKDDISYTDFVTRLVRAQWQAKQEGALEWRIQRANLPERWTLETFPYTRQPGVNRKQIRGFAELEFIAKAENIVLVGDTGRGKTGLACGLLLKALENGYRCQFIKAQDLFDEMYASLADRSTRQLLKRLARLDVLLIDEFGYLNLKPEQSNIFFKLMEERYRQHPTIITTNLGYDEWPNFLGNRPMVEALLSRLRHYCHTVHIKGPSLRELQGCGAHRGRRHRTGRICSPCLGGVPQNAGHDGSGSPSRPHARRSTLPARHLSHCRRERAYPGGNSPAHSAERCATIGYGSLASVLPASDRGSAGTPSQPRLLPISPSKASANLSEPIGCGPPSRARMMETNRTPTAWMISPAPPPPQDSPSARMMPPTSHSRSQYGSRGGSLHPSATGSFLRSTEGSARCSQNSADSLQKVVRLIHRVHTSSVRESQRSLILDPLEPLPQCQR